MEDIWESKNIDLLVTKIKDVDRLLKKPNIRAVSYLFRKEIDLLKVFTLAKEKYGCETNKDPFYFVVMVMKLSCCSTKLVKELVKVVPGPVDPFLLKADGFQLLNKSLDDDVDFGEALISKLKMRAVLISLDSKLESDHDKKLRDCICVQLPVSDDRYDTNFSLYEHLENTGKIEPGKLEVIRRALSMDSELQYALKHFDSITTSSCHSKSIEETDQSPPCTAEKVTGATPSSVSSTDTSSSATENYSPVANDSATLAFPTNSTSTQTELSNSENPTFGDN